MRCDYWWRKRSFRIGTPKGVSSYLCRDRSRGEFLESRESLTLSYNKTIQDIARRWAIAQPSVVAFISLLVPRYHDAQDVLQEVAAVVLSYEFDKKGWPESFDGWVLGIAR